MSSSQRQEAGESGIASLSLRDASEGGAGGGQGAAQEGLPPSVEGPPPPAQGGPSLQAQVRELQEEIRLLRRENRELRSQQEQQGPNQPARGHGLPAILDTGGATAVLLYVDPSNFQGQDTSEGMPSRHVYEHLMRTTDFYHQFCQRVDPVLLLPSLCLPPHLEETVRNMSWNLNKLWACQALWGFLLKQPDWTERLGQALREEKKYEDLYDIFAGACRTASPKEGNKRVIQEPEGQDHDNLKNGVARFQGLSLLDPGGPAESPEGGSRAAAEAEEPPFTLDDAAADRLMLFNILRPVKAQLEPSHIEEMAAFLPKGPGRKPQTCQDLFDVMQSSGRLAPYDVIYLQALLWTVGRKDLFEEVARQVKETNNFCRRKIAHLDVPRLEPVNGYEYVEFHVQVPNESISDHLVKLRDGLVRVLRVPEGYVKYINVVSGKIVQSILVTVAMPLCIGHLLQDNFYLPEVQALLADLGVDYVLFHHCCPRSVSSGKPSSAEALCKDEQEEEEEEEEEQEEKQEREQEEEALKVNEKEQQEKQEGEALEKNEEEEEKEKQVKEGEKEQGKTESEEKKDKQEKEQKQEDAATAALQTSHKSEPGDDEIRLLKSFDLYYESGRVFCFPEAREPETPPPRTASSPVWRTEQAVQVGSPTASQDRRRVLLQRLRAALQGETAPGAPPAFLLCNAPRLASQAAPRPDVLLALHWRLGVLLVAVGDTAEAAAGLREAGRLLLQEMRGLVSEQAVTLVVVAWPPLGQQSSPDSTSQPGLEADVEVLQGCGDADFRKLVTDVGQRRESLPAFLGSSVEERQRNFKLSFVRQCIFAPSSPSSSPWLLPTPEQLSVLCSGERALAIVGPPVSGKTSVLVEHGRQWRRQGHSVAVVAADPTQRRRLQQAIREGAEHGTGWVLARGKVTDLREFSDLSSLHLIVEDDADVFREDILSQCQEAILTGRQTPPRHVTDRIKSVGGSIVHLPRSWRVPTSLLPWINRIRDKATEPELQAVPTESPGGHDTEPELQAVPTESPGGHDMEPVLIRHRDHAKGDAFSPYVCAECKTRLQDALSKSSLPVEGESPGTLSYSKAVAVVFGDREEFFLRDTVESLKRMGLPAEGLRQDDRYSIYPLWFGESHSTNWQKSGAGRQTPGQEVLQVLHCSEFRDQEHSLALLVYDGRYSLSTTWEDLREQMYQALCRCRGHVILLASADTPVISLLSGASPTLQENRRTSN